jgi:Tfp pilus assembly protein PilZ
MVSKEGRHRRFERVELRARVQLTSIDPERDPLTGIPTLWESDELCETLSVGGAFIRTLDPPAKGRRILLQIHLPNGESVETSGRIAWTRVPLGGVRESGVGVEFAASDGETRGALERFLSRARSVRAE